MKMQAPKDSTISVVSVVDSKGKSVECKVAKGVVSIPDDTSAASLEVLASLGFTGVAE